MLGARKDGTLPTMYLDTRTTQALDAHSFDVPGGGKNPAAYAKLRSNKPTRL